MCALICTRTRKYILPYNLCFDNQCAILNNQESKISGSVSGTESNILSSCCCSYSVATSVEWAVVFKVKVNFFLEELLEVKAVIPSESIVAYGYKRACN